jgi:hypothetical protein
VSATRDTRHEQRQGPPFSSWRRNKVGAGD